jgi:hypothetical protein
MLSGGRWPSVMCWIGEGRNFTRELHRDLTSRIHERPAMEDFHKKFAQERTGRTQYTNLILAIQDGMSAIASMPQEHAIAELDSLRVRLKKLDILYTENVSFLPPYEQRRIQTVEPFWT